MELGNGLFKSFSGIGLHLVCPLPYIVLPISSGLEEWLHGFCKKKGQSRNAELGSRKKSFKECIAKNNPGITTFLQTFYRANDKKVTWLNPIFKRQG